MDAHDAGRTARSLETLHALCYFSAEVESSLVDLGLRKGRMCYFAGRAAAMGRVGAGPVTATFYVFNPSLVGHFIPSAWELASPEDVHEARYRGVDTAYRNLLGDDVVVSAEMEEAAGIARELAAGCTPEGRALHAAHADLAWPEEPHLVLFHALTLVREHRGDGHVAALVHAGLSGREALVTHTATGKGFTVPAAQATRGWSAAEWQDSVDALADRGLMTRRGRPHRRGHRAARAGRGRHRPPRSRAVGRAGRREGDPPARAGPPVREAGGRGRGVPRRGLRLSLSASRHRKDRSPGALR